MNTFRNWFVFDLSGLGGTIDSATLELQNPSNGVLGTPGIFTLRQVTTDLTSIMDGTAGIAAYNDFGDGLVFGSVPVSTGDNGTTVSINLNSDAINAMNISGGLFAFGGSVSNDNTDNYAFGFTHPGGARNSTEPDYSP